LFESVRTIVGVDECSVLGLASFACRAGETVNFFSVVWAGADAVTVDLGAAVKVAGAVATVSVAPAAVVLANDVTTAGLLSAVEP
jgi:hypothetical protein